MPHKNGRIYSSVDADGNKIGINTDDVGAVLGSGSHTVNNLCRHSNIRKFNKDKPYRGTSPEVASRTVDNANGTGDNGTGKYCGARGTTNDFPIYWGMKYPMNTIGQKPSGKDSNNLFEICYYVATRAAGITYPNYEYQKPVADVDFCRLDDFDGYDHNNLTPFLEVGVVGAKPGNNSVSTLETNKFENNKLTVFAQAKNPDFSFKDIIPEGNSYYFVAEFYKLDDWKDSSLTQSSLPVPFYTVWNTKALSSTDDRSLTIDILLSTIKTKGDFSNTANMNFVVCLGFNKWDQSAGTWAYNRAFVAPWTGDGACATKVSTSQASPYNVFFTQYAGPTGDYANFPSTPTSVTFDTMRFKATVDNNSNSAMNIFGVGSTQTSGLRFRAKAVGSYGAYEQSNGGHLENGGDNSNGAWRDLKVGNVADVGSTDNNVSIPAGTSMTLYFKADNLLPYGYTTGIIIEVSNDNGASWSTTGMKVAYFNRLNA